MGLKSVWKRKDHRIHLRKILVFLTAILFSSVCYADLENPLNFTEADGSPDTYPYKVSVSNGTLTDNGDGTISINTSGSGGTPGGANTQVQFNDAGSFGGVTNFTFTKATNLLQNTRLTLSGDGVGTTGVLRVISGDAINQYVYLKESVQHPGQAYITLAGYGGNAMAMGGIFNGGEPSYYVFTDAGGNERFTVDMNGNITADGSAVLGTPLEVAYGGTGTNTHTNGGVLLGTATSAIHNTGVLAKGDLIVGDGSTDPVLLTVGADGTILSADASTASGARWVVNSPGEKNTASNLGNGVGTFKQKSVLDLQFKSLVSGDLITITQDANSIVINTTAQANTASNIGTGNQLFKQKSGVDLQFRTVTSSDNVIMTTNANDVSISVPTIPSEDVVGVVATVKGGTGQSSYTKGDVLVAQDGVTLTKLAVGSNGMVLSADSNQLTGIKWSYPTQFFDSNGVLYLISTPASSAVNYVNISNDVTTKGPTIKPEGSDANIDLRLRGKGTGAVSMDTAMVTNSAVLTDGATITIDASLGNNFLVTLGGNRTLGTPINAKPRQKIMLIVSQDATGSRTLAYSPAFRFGTDVTSPTLSTAAGTNDYLGIVYNPRGSAARQLSFDVVAVSKGYAP